MIPYLPVEATVPPLYHDYLGALQESGFGGDIARDYASRLTVATDNSAFQRLPAAVLFPGAADDLERILCLAGDPRFHEVRLAPRGGGTSTIGCSLTAGIVIDCSRHMNRIVAVDAESHQVRVQPGVVLDQLNDHLAEYGLFFAPNVAPSNRATLGGMANTDGCGKGSRVYGKTSDHVLAADLVLADGTRWRAAPCDKDSLTGIRARNDTVGRVHAEVDDVITEHRDEIARVFPDLKRYLSGYNLAQIWDEDTSRFNLNKLICGSEGTLAVVAELTLNVLPIPKARTLFALRYYSFDDALRDAEKLVAYEPSAIESLDDKVMGLARNNPIYERVRDYIENADGSTPDAVNLVEFAVAPNEDLAERIADFQRYLATDADSRALGFYHAETEAAMAALWDLRKGGVGLLGSTPGKRKPLPFVEDTVVDPRVLADYVHDFRAILDEYGLDYGMFGHIDVGCLHVRPALDLTDPDDERIMREIMDRVEMLVRQYGGLVWNEHGKGFRSQYNPDYFGPALYGALGRIKRAFDPHNQLNPGKVVVPADDETPLAAMDAPTRGAYDRQIDPAQREHFAPPLACNGNGACFNYDPYDVMCPSYRGTRNRLHSPKGRANAMREWLRQLSAAGQYTLPEPRRHPAGLAGAAAIDAMRCPPNPDANQDFSHEVWTAMDGCLSCKACATQCPVKVDVPTFKAEFLSVYHQRYARPLGDYALAALEPMAAIAARTPRLANMLIKISPVRWMTERWFGLSDLPQLSPAPLHRWLDENPGYRFSRERLFAMTADERQRAVGIVQDAFTSFFDADVVKTTLTLLSQLGYIPLLLPFESNGKALQVKGFLAEFEGTAGRMAAYLRDFAALDLPLLGIEPSVTLTYRDEYPKVLGAQATPRVWLVEEWLAQANLPEPIPPADDTPPVYRLLQHCTAATTFPASSRAWQRVFAAFGCQLNIEPTGCCGMSGAYGHETRHQDTSRRIFDLSWAGLVADGADNVVVPGYSCRSQIHRCADLSARHPASILLKHLQSECFLSANPGDVLLRRQSLGSR